MKNIINNTSGKMLGIGFIGLLLGLQLDLSKILTKPNLRIKTSVTRPEITPTHTTPTPKTVQNKSNHTSENRNKNGFKIPPCTEEDADKLFGLIIKLMEDGKRLDLKETIGKSHIIILLDQYALENPEHAKRWYYEYGLYLERANPLLHGTIADIFLKSGNIEKIREYSHILSSNGYDSSHLDNFLSQNKN